MVWSVNPEYGWLMADQGEGHIVHHVFVVPSLTAYSPLQAKLDANVLGSGMALRAMCSLAACIVGFLGAYVRTDVVMQYCRSCSAALSAQRQWPSGLECQSLDCSIMRVGSNPT